MIYERYDKLWKIWLLVPFIMLIASAIVLLDYNARTGSFVGRDVELVGGNRITMELDKQVDFSALQDALPYAKMNIISGIRNELLVETAPDISVEQVLDDLGKFGLNGEYNLKTVGPFLGDIFWEQAQLAIISAFVLMALVLFIIFRNVVSSSIIIFSVVTDVIVTLAVMDVFGINMSLPVLAALLMIVGYSVDDNILLTTNMLKVRSGEISNCIKTGLMTGLTMFLAILVALSALFVVSGTFVLGQIALVLIVGVIVDMIVTWMGNANILRLWLIRHERAS